LYYVCYIICYVVIMNCFIHYSFVKHCKVLLLYKCEWNVKWKIHTKQSRTNTFMYVNKINPIPAHSFKYINKTNFLFLGESLRNISFAWFRFRLHFLLVWLFFPLACLLQFKFSALGFLSRTFNSFHFDFT